MILHGDNQADISDLSSLWKVSLENNHCTVLGSRFADTRRLHGYSLLRTNGNRVLNILYTLLLGKNISDLGSGLNLFAKKDFNNAQVFLSFDDGFTFNMDLLIYLSQKSQPLFFCPISWKSEDEKSNASAFRVGWRALIKILTAKISMPKTQWTDQ